MCEEDACHTKARMHMVIFSHTGRLVYLKNTVRTKLAQRERSSRFHNLSVPFKNFTLARAHASLAACLDLS